MNIKFSSRPAERRAARRGAVTPATAALLGSVAVHGGALLAAAHAGVGAATHAPTESWAPFTVSVVAEEPPVAEALPVAEPARPREPRRVPTTQAPMPAAAPSEAAPPSPEVPTPAPPAGVAVSPAGVGVASVDGGLAVNATAGPGGGSGTAAGVAAVPPAVDLRALAKGWVERVSAVVGAKASQEYPASARRARTEGLVVVGVVVDASGRIVSTELRRSSGHPVLDGAALAALRDLGHVPAPPAALAWRPRPLSFPIHYRLEVL